MTDHEALIASGLHECASDCPLPEYAACPVCGLTDSPDHQRAFHAEQDEAVPDYYATNEEINEWRRTHGQSWVDASGVERPGDRLDQGGPRAAATGMDRGGLGAGQGGSGASSSSPEEVTPPPVPAALDVLLDPENAGGGHGAWKPEARQITVWLSDDDGCSLAVDPVDVAALVEYARLSHQSEDA